MIVMLSAHRRRRILQGARLPAGGRRPKRLGSRDAPGCSCRAGLNAAILLWTTIALSVDGVTEQSFFLTHPVDGISAGSEGATGASLFLVLSDIPSRRTGRAACLHRLSTDLCTARLDVVRGSQKTVSTVL
jgi:hypothetical protein